MFLLFLTLCASSSRAFLRTLRAIFRAALFAVSHANRVERAAHNVITHAWQILDTSSANQNDRVLLEVVPDTRDVRSYFNLIGQPDARNLAQSRVRLFRRLGLDLHTNSASLRAGLERRARCLVFDLLTSFANKLVDSRHIYISLD